MPKIDELPNMFGAILEHYRETKSTKAEIQSLVGECATHIDRWPIDTGTMAGIFRSVDDAVFGGLLVYTLRTHGMKINFEHGDLGPLVAGRTKFTYMDPDLRFHMNGALFEGVFRGEEKASYTTGGLKCGSMEECYINIFFHEMCHVFIYLYRTVNRLREWGERSHGQTFKLLLSNVFLQVDHRHTLIPGFDAYADDIVVRADVKKAMGHGEKMEYFNIGDGRWDIVTVVGMYDKYTEVKGDRGPSYCVPTVLMRPLDI